MESMRSVCAAAGTALFACQFSLMAEPTIPCLQTVNAPLQSRAVLIIDSRPAGLEIVGSDQESIRVSCTAETEDGADQVHLHFSPTSNGGKLSIEGTQARHGNHGLHIKIEVPRRTNLQVRMFAGEVKVEDIKGDKDIDLGAGQITISSIHEWDYKRVDASVGVGEVRAQAFHSDKGGFFRNFNRNTSHGDYRLHAHVTTGEIDLLGSSEGKVGESKPD